MSTLSAGILLFLIMDPLGNIPLFLSLLKNVAPERRRLVLIRELLIALVVLFVFLFGGKYLEIQVGGETMNMKDGDRFGFLQDSVIVEELIEKIVNYAEDQRKKAPAAEKAKP